MQYFREWAALKLVCKALSANPGNPSEILNSDFNVVPDFVFFFFFRAVEEEKSTLKAISCCECQRSIRIPI